MTTVVRLSFGFAAVVIAEEDDRPRYVPPLLDRSEHAEDCRCDACVMVRQAATRIAGTHQP